MNPPMNHADNDDGMSSGVFWITRCIAQGGWVGADLGKRLHEQGVTHLFNVGDARYPRAVKHIGFSGFAWKPLEDLKRIPDERALEVLDKFHEFVVLPTSRVYIHCVAGQNRSPTILWLYLVACGMTQGEARSVISGRTFDAIPGHPLLIDEALVARVSEHGRSRYLPHVRPEALQPVEVD